MILGVIPARYASSRFPGKPLVDIKGKSMIRRVYEQCQKSNLLSDVVVATDDQRIFDHVIQFGGKAEMTAITHKSGTERICEIAHKFTEYDFYINIQGDEPFINPDQIDTLCTLLMEKGTQIATLVKPLTKVSQLESNDNAKVVLSHEGDALYFSRSPIPHFKSIPNKEEWLTQITYYLHIGIYGFDRQTLLSIPNMAPSPLEQAESLEQLRWLANGCKIRTAITDTPTISIDTPLDLKEVLEKM